MRVIIVLPELSYRGGERIFYTLAKGLAQKGHKVSILAGRVRSDAFQIKRPVKLIAPPTALNKLFQNNLLFLLLQLPYLFLSIVLNSKNVDIVHSESGLTLWASILAGKIKRIGVVWMIFAFETRPFRSSFINNLFLLTLRKVDKFFAVRAGGYTCIAPRIARAVGKLYGIRDIEVIIPAIDMGRFENPDPQSIVKKHKLEGKRILLHPGTLHPKKNQELAIRSMEKVIEEFPNTLLILVGGGADGGRLKDIVNKKNLQKNVIFAGVARGDKIKNYYALADLVLVTSKVENEGLSMTALEALANGTLPVVSRGAGVSEILDKMRVAIVVRPKVFDYSGAILSYLREREKYEKMIEKGRSWVLGELTVEKFAEKTLTVYEKCLLRGLT